MRPQDPVTPPEAAVFPFADAGHFDELHGRPTIDSGKHLPCSEARPADIAGPWARFFDHVPPADWHALNQRSARLARQLRDSGVTYNAYADEANLQRSWPLDLFPLLITPQDWRRIETGVLQRVRVLDAVMRDMYGERRLLKDGLIPAALVQGHPDYLRAMHGVPAAGGMHLHIVAFDLARGPHGYWWVVAQRTQAPSGLGYLLENRSAISAQFPEAFQAMHVHRLAASYRALIDNLKALAPGGGDSHIALLTPGPYNETYFEHAYLARYLGVTLVEGSDLTVRNQRLYLKTLGGLKPVHGLIKRVDDAWLDPLEMRPDSRLGVPGLLQCVRAGHVLLANAPGAGFLESSALLGFLPALTQHLLGQELQLPALHTWWCGEAAAMHSVLPQLAHCVIKATYPWSASRSTFNAGVGPRMDAATLAAWADRIRQRPEEHTVQAYLPPSQIPTWVPTPSGHGAGGNIVPRAAILRVFALSDGAGSWRVLPGGMTRLVGESAGLATMALGGSSADTWVLGEHDSEGAGDTDFDHSTLVAITPADTALVQRERLVTSRAAENLFWLGRYSERAENGARLVRVILDTLHGDEEPSWAVRMWLGQLAHTCALVPESAPTPEQNAAAFEHELLRCLAQPDDPPGLANALHGMRRAGSALRERLSPEHWAALKDADEHFAREVRELDIQPGTALADAHHVLAHLGRQLAAITGAQHDRMWRDDGWRLLSVGRQIERLTFLCKALSRGFYTNAVHDAAGYGVVLDLFDSTLSFHARHQRSRSVAALIEHVVLNHQNPRSLGWVVETLGRRLARLRDTTDPAAPTDELPTRLRPAPPQDLTRLCEADAIGDFTHLQQLLAHYIDAADELSRDIARRHFSHTAEFGRSLGA
ncbi:MAG: circularly permuted type 2 ATP-grasp protein [Pseudomonadota bacterium]|nr:circularly permuted type 2 ATP-grasp protein [Pseudomonadota bacterium]